MSGVVKETFGVIGAAGYVAPVHLDAIARLGGRVTVACDLSDSVGVLDRDFYGCQFFRHPELLSRYLREQYARERGVEYLTICTPNHLHVSHMLLGLDHGAHVICEKPLALDERELDQVAALAEHRGLRVHPVLQLRYHPKLLSLRQGMLKRGNLHDVELTQITPRGPWYHTSWKGDAARSGGVVTNIGIHTLDMLLWLFGELQSFELHHQDSRAAAGTLHLERARVRWFLSISREHLPSFARLAQHPSYRCLSVDGEVVDYSSGLSQLHSLAYQDILRGRGAHLGDAVAAVKLARQIREAEPTGQADQAHQALLRGVS